MADETWLNIVAQMDVPTRSEFRLSSRHNKALATEFVLDARLQRRTDLGRLLTIYPNLETLLASGRGLIPADAHALAAHRSLREVDASFNQLGDAGAQILATSPRLNILDLDNNQLGLTPGVPGVHALAANPRIIELALSQNKLGPDAAQAVSRSTSITHLYMHDNFTRLNADAAAQALANSTSITHLDVTWNHFGDAALEALASNSRFTHFNLANNAFTDTGGVALASRRGIVAMYLSNNRVGDATALAIAANPTIVDVDLRMTDVTPVGRAALEIVRPRFTNLRL
jgi:hypothetical protein